MCRAGNIFFRATCIFLGVGRGRPFYLSLWVVQTSVGRTELFIILRRRCIVWNCWCGVSSRTTTVQPHVLQKFEFPLKKRGARTLFTFLPVSARLRTPTVLPRRHAAVYFWPGARAAMGIRSGQRTGYR